MPEFLGPVEPMKIDTELGAIYVSPVGLHSLNVNAPHLTVDAVPLQASLFLVSGDALDFHLMPHLDLTSGVSTIAEHSISARLVDGRQADLVTLGKIAQVVIPAVCRFAQTNKAFLLEAERRRIHNEIVVIEQEIADKHIKLAEKQRELEAIKAQLP